ncbi:MAG: hypothetical protein R3B90_02265 [Planctomycetaceae bacterium]
MSQSPRPLVIALFLPLAGLLGLSELPAAALPVREVTIFKDGHAFVLHAGEAAVDADGHVRLDDLPTPVIGTMWSFSRAANASLTGVAAGPRRVEVEQSALTIRELIAANPGAQVLVHQTNELQYLAKIIGIPTRDADEVARLSPDSATVTLSQPGDIVLLETEAGVRAVPIDSLKELTFAAEPTRTLTTERIRNQLTMRLDWRGGQPTKTADVGMTYLQKGLRWIPQYRVTLGDNGKATVELQATLINELADLEDVTAHLVIGVPSFYFKETLDPLALGQTLDRLSAYFRNSGQNGGSPGMNYITSNFSNSIMMQTQVSRMGENHAAGGGAGEGVAIPELTQGDSDLFLFSLEHLTLARGERMIVQIDSWELPAEDLYTLKLPFAPPRELRQYFESQHQAELAQLQSQPQVKHVARLKNETGVPLTTAPAIIIRDGRPLAQAMMTYTSPGSTVDLEVTTAVNLPPSIEEEQTGQIPNAAQFGGDTYERIEMRGTISATNYHNKPVRLEIERMVLGVATEASSDGKITRPGGAGQVAGTWLGSDARWWWSYSWPGWWHRVNSVSRIRWNVDIPAGESIELIYQWHYFWR